MTTTNVIILVLGLVALVGCIDQFRRHYWPLTADPARRNKIDWTSRELWVTRGLLFTAIIAILSVLIQTFLK